MAKKKDKTESPGLAEETKVRDTAPAEDNFADAPDADSLETADVKGAKKGSRKPSKAKSRDKKEWEDSIVSSKRVKREEGRRRLKKILLIFLAFSIITTSVVYVMLLFVQENSMRITASSSDSRRSIALSMDNSNWMPYLDAVGPDFMRDISYNPVYGREKLPTMSQALEIVGMREVIGNRTGQSYIAFGFTLRNTSSEAVELPLRVTMEMRSDKRNLQNAIRIMWAESFTKKDDTVCYVYAAPSDNDRLAALAVNSGVQKGSYVEKISYPYGADDKSSANYNLGEYEQTETDEQKEYEGFIDTVPFASHDKIFERGVKLQDGEMMFVYVCVWIEGSDFDCTDDKLGGYVSLAINFQVM